MDPETAERTTADHPTDRRRTPDRVWSFGLIGAAAATAVNVTIFAIAVASGVSFRMRGQADVFETFQAFTTGFRQIHAYNVAIDTAVPFLVGSLLFRLAARRSRGAAIGALVLAGAASILVLTAVTHTATMTSPAIEVLSAMDVIAIATFIGVLIPALPPRRGRAPLSRRSG